ncbi:hypothetical protein AJ79_09330 [Helicocarpus griseus UAMH5409]|uniref:Methyltransferase domain-containing protein n=1 Tax=Helicocarpus griseus UAMH5409 TaxID=1447875 RepID=A0A2B7WKU5_9EURO|nr:hypothetical protein AJ79_09330 [Helicocarpus griseus UAMH5409]
MSNNEEQTTILEVDTDAPGDSDSSYGDELSGYSTSLATSVKNFEFKHGPYQFPNDEPEQERLDMFHHIVTLSCGKKLHLAPFNPDGARILDLGTGTGIWAIEMGDTYPKAELVSQHTEEPLSPSRVPPNVKFVVDDVESDWVPSEPYDYIHSRYLAASIQDWPRLVKQCFDSLKPGGWVEFQDADGNLYSEDGSLEKMEHKHKGQEMIELLDEVCKKHNRVLHPGPGLKKWVEDAGFINVKEEVHNFPIGLWPKDKTMKEIGAFMAIQYTEGVEAFTIQPFTNVLGWKPEEVQVFNAQVRSDIKRKDIHAMLNL